MGIMDKVKDLIAGNADKANQGIAKAAQIADDKTGGKYSEQIDTGAEKAKDAVEKLGDDTPNTPNTPGSA